MRWHPFTKTSLEQLGFHQDAPDGDMLRGNWRMFPDQQYSGYGDVINQYPLTLEHETRGVCLKIFEPPMLHLLQMLG